MSTEGVVKLLRERTLPGTERLRWGAITEVARQLGLTYAEVWAAARAEGLWTLARPIAAPPPAHPRKDPITLEIEAAMAEAADADRVLPRGTLSRLAARYGRSRERLSQLAARAGYTAGSAPQTARGAATWPCSGNCGASLPRPGRCPDCRRATVPCAWCAAPVTRSASLIARRRAGGSAIFCGHVCAGKNAAASRLAGADAG